MKTIIHSKEKSICEIMLELQKETEFPVEFKIDRCTGIANNKREAQLLSLGMCLAASALSLEEHWNEEEWGEDEEGRQRDCNHIVGFYCANGVDEQYLVKKSEIVEGTKKLAWPDDKFKFCPECGAEIDWSDIDYG